MRGKQVGPVTATGLNILLPIPASFVFLVSKLDTDSPRRGGMVDSRSAVVPVVLVLLRVAGEQTGDGGDNNGEVARAQSDASLEGTREGRPIGKTKDHGGVCEGKEDGDPGTDKNHNQTEAGGGRDTNGSENPDGSDDQGNPGESLDWRGEMKEITVIR